MWKWTGKLYVVTTKQRGKKQPRPESCRTRYLPGMTGNIHSLYNNLLSAARRRL